VGYPLDPFFREIQRRSAEVIAGVTAEAVAAGYDVFEGTAFSHAKFWAWAKRHGLKWPATDTGKVTLKDTKIRQLETALRGMGHKKPAELVAGFRRLQATRDVLGDLGNMGSADDRRVEVCADGRSRPFLNPFGSVIGRNQPGGDFLFSKAKWTRYLLKPHEGYGVAYLDWVAQEIIILAAMSGDQNMLADYTGGDPYIALGVAAGLCPEGATKDTHPEVRANCKIAFLAVCYGAKAYGLSQSIEIPISKAEKIVAGHKERYHAFHTWHRNFINRATYHGKCFTLLG
jgi:DNA polymerase-1